MVLSSETNATPLDTAPAGGIELAVTGKSEDKVLTGDIHDTRWPLRNPFPDRFQRRLCNRFPLNKSKRLRRCGRIDDSNESESVRVSYAGALPGCACCRKISGGRCTHNVCVRTGVDRHPQGDVPKRELPGPPVPPKYVEYTCDSGPVAAVVLISVRKALPFTFSCAVEICVCRRLGNSSIASTPTMYAFPHSVNSNTVSFFQVSPPR